MHESLRMSLQRQEVCNTKKAVHACLNQGQFGCGHCEPTFNTDIGDESELKPAFSAEF